jgi:hypothetical protein
MVYRKLGAIHANAFDTLIAVFDTALPRVMAITDQHASPTNLPFPLDINVFEDLRHEHYERQDQRHRAPTAVVRH